MTYRVIVTPKARIELYNDAVWWAENRSIEQAARWLDGFEQAIENLATNPERHPLARESNAFLLNVARKRLGLRRSYRTYRRERCGRLRVVRASNLVNIQMGCSVVWYWR